MKLGIVIQARMGSSRLPGKVLRPIAGRPLLAHVRGRLEALQHEAQSVVATSVLERDNAVADWCESAGVLCFRGSEDDVLDRYLRCAQHFGFTQVVRLTADNPFTDIVELDRLIDYHLEGGFDYTHAFGMMPLGVGAEIFTFHALQLSHEHGHQPHHREHVNEYITDYPELFRIGVLDVPESKRRPDLRLTVDTEQDWRRARAIAGQTPDRWIGTEEAIALCSRFA
ncbi:MAG: cytidylyltransferase domain-containing protein [Rhodomicrobium sp.]